jgi:hypothetical protein
MRYTVSKCHNRISEVEKSRLLFFDFVIMHFLTLYPNILLQNLIGFPYCDNSHLIVIVWFLKIRWAGISVTSYIWHLIKDALTTRQNSFRFILSITRDEHTTLKKIQVLLNRYTLSCSSDLVNCVRVLWGELGKSSI